MPKPSNVPSFIKISDSTISLLIKLAPRSSANRIIGEHAGRLKIAITAPPVDGKANELLVSFLADIFKVPKSEVSIRRGETSREKEVEINGLAADKLIAIIAELKK